MRRRPQIERPARGGDIRPLGPPSPRQPQQQGDVIDPFLVSGGQTLFIVQDNPPGPEFHPQPEGVQLITSLYVPAGRVGFVKEIRVAPFMPTELADPWTTSGVTGASWRDILGNQTEAPGGTNGVWTTPFGWESYFNPPLSPPEWRWFLRFLPGNIDLQRVAFDLTNAATWFLQENIAVPASVYPSGIPGVQASGYWRPQRMQVIQGDKLNTHVLVPPDTTICLWARWSQSLYQPNASQQGAEGIVNAPYGDVLYPLLPSFGQLHGYIQAADRVASTENAEYGWGG